MICSLYLRALRLEKKFCGLVVSLPTNGKEFHGPLRSQSRCLYRKIGGFRQTDFEAFSQTEQKTAMGSFGCIKSLADLPSEKTLIQYVKKAAALNDAGIKAPGRTQRYGDVVIYEHGVYPIDQLRAGMATLMLGKEIMRFVNHKHEAGLAKKVFHFHLHVGCFE
jgi:hypothetical protein